MSHKKTERRRGRPAGTPHNLTHAIQERICEKTRTSVPPNHAAAMAGVAERTFYSWLEKGAQGIQPYAAFARAIRRAVGEAVCMLTVRALSGGPGAAQAFGMLERRFPQEYGRRSMTRKAREDESRRIEAERRNVESRPQKPEARRKLAEAFAIATADLSEEERVKLSAFMPGSTPGRRGRPPGGGQKLTPAVQEGILEALRIAVPEKYAADKEGIDECTYSDWLAKGERGIPPFADFALAVHSANAQAVHNLTARALAGSAEALKLLECRYPEEYGQRFSTDQRSDADRAQFENARRLGEVIRSNPQALRLVHEALLSEISDS